MNDKHELLRHFLVALAYRTQKALRKAPADFGSLRVSPGVRTPSQLLCHMTSVLGYARTFYVGGTYRAEDLPSLEEEIVRFHNILHDLARHIEAGTELREGMTPERLLQGPLADALSHAGQLGLLRRLSGSPVPPENFIVADIDSTRLGVEQSDPVSPDLEWPEAPPAWVPPNPPNHPGGRKRTQA